MASALEGLLLAAEYLEREEACASKAQGGVTTVARDTTPTFTPYSHSFSWGAHSTLGDSIKEEPEYDSSPNNDHLGGMASSTSTSHRRTQKHRETHNTLEKNRRAYMKACFNRLKHVIPDISDQRCSTIGTLQSATEYIDKLKKTQAEQAAQIDSLKRQRQMLEQLLAQHDPSYTPTVKVEPPPAFTYATTIPTYAPPPVISETKCTQYTSESEDETYIDVVTVDTQLPATNPLAIPKNVAQTLTPPSTVSSESSCSPQQYGTSWEPTHTVARKQSNTAQPMQLG
eukprot:comp18987_c0_seq1/m.21317 comp18987_c0_seq1/g.21317  ORF comp18987_c0_seq1/g.21317 comp18987_c0_seq1/m.21317 type:complete len:285 (-) comp18987_c0_seq1:643-1497(-)